MSEKLTRMEFSKNFIIIVNQSGEIKTYPNKSFHISTAGSDFLIHLYHKTIALDWDEECRITFSELYKIIKHRWTILKEYGKGYFCGDCDGYDYEDCDYSRCKNDCENCGGRRYICNNGCFYYRYNAYLRIECDNDLVEKDLKEDLILIEYIMTPHSEDHNKIIEKYGDYIEQHYNECRSVRHFCTCNAIEAFISNYELMKKKELDRATNNNDRVVIAIQEDGQYSRYCVKKNIIKLDDDVLLPFFKSNRLIIEINDGYDYCCDNYCNMKKNLKFVNRKDKEQIKDALKRNDVNVIGITIKNEKVETVAIV